MSLLDDEMGDKKLPYHVNEYYNHSQSTTRSSDSLWRSTNKDTTSLGQKVVVANILEVFIGQGHG